MKRGGRSSGSGGGEKRAGGKRPFGDKRPAFGKRPTGGKPGARDGGRPERKDARSGPRSFSARDRFKRDERPSRGPSAARHERERNRDAAPVRTEAPARELAPRATDDGRFIWGVNPVLEALRANPDRIERILMQDGGLGPKVAAEVFTRVRDAGIRVDKVDRDRLASMSDGGVHQGLAAEVRQFDYLELDSLIKVAKGSARAPLIVVLDGIQDPHNLGAIIRSAHAFGAHGVVIAKDRAAGVTGIVAKSSAGAIEYCPVARVTNISRALEELKKADFWTVAADPEGDRTLWAADLKGPIVVVVGAEGPGVRDGVMKQCDFRVQIPMVGKVASLNASVSAGVLLAEVARQRVPAPAVMAVSESGAV